MNGKSITSPPTISRARMNQSPAVRFFLAFGARTFAIVTLVISDHSSSSFATFSCTLVKIIDTTTTTTVNAVEMAAP